MPSPDNMASGLALCGVAFVGFDANFKFVGTGLNLDLVDVGYTCFAVSHIMDVHGGEKDFAG